MISAVSNGIVFSLSISLKRLAELCMNGMKRSVYVSSLFGVVAQILLISFSMVRADIIWANEVALRMQNGLTYGAGFFENNPPLIFFMHRLSRLMASFFDIEPIMMWHGLIMLGSAISFIVLCRFAAKLAQDNTLLKRAFYICIWLALFITPMIGFGQREQVMVMLSFPYFFHLALRLLAPSQVETKYLRLIGLMASLGLALKPHFFPALVLLELLYGFHQLSIKAWWRQELIALVAVQFLYLFSIFTFTPSYFSNVFYFAITTYQQYKVSVGAGLYLSFSLIGFYILSIFAFIAAKRSRPYRAMIVYFWLFAFGTVLTYWLQRKGWTYQAIPMMSAITILVAPILAGFNQQRSKVKYQITHTVFALEVILVYGFFILADFVNVTYPFIRCYLKHDCFEWQIVSYAKAGLIKGSFYPLTQRFSLGMTGLYYGKLQSASRFSNYWLLADKVNLADTYSQKLTRQWIIEDFKKNQPQYVVLDQCFKNQDGYYDFLKLLNHSDDFKKLWRRYQLVPVPKQLDPHQCVKLYSRATIKN